MAENAVLPPPYPNLTARLHPLVTKLTALATELRIMLKKHDRILSLLGAMLVLATFVAKDGVREGWKATADSIEAAVSLSVVRNQVVTMQESQDALKSDLSTFIAMLPQTLAADANISREKPPVAFSPMFVSPDKNPYSFFDFEERSRVLDSNLERYDVIDGLIHRLPYDGNLKETLESYKYAIDEYSRTVDHAWNALDANKRILPDVQPISSKDWKAIYVARTRIDLHRNLLLDQTYKSAHGFEEASKEKARIASSWTNCFFALGWLLGLVGKLTGNPVASPE